MRSGSSARGADLAGVRWGVCLYAQSLKQAIHGEVVMTPRLSSTLNALFDARVPSHWVFTVGGDELSWLSSTLGVWFAGLLQRDAQLRGWLNGGRPIVYWLTGFFNPQVRGRPCDVCGVAGSGRGTRVMLASR